MMKLQKKPLLMHMRCLTLKTKCGKIITLFRGENMKKCVPLLFKVVYLMLVILAFHFFLPEGVEKKAIFNDNIKKTSRMEYNAVPKENIIETFYGQLTGYGPDCDGCIGITTSGYDVRGGNIYYEDNLYGKLRILAADKKVPFGTIMRITVPNIYKEPIVAIVLDRGYLIKNDKFDLLFNNEEETKPVGRQKNVKFEVLRYGW